MKVFVTGNRGMLGQDLAPVLQREGYDLTCVDVDGLDITRKEDVHRAIQTCRPDLVVNCAAYTAVDRAEQEKDKAFAVNRDGAGFLAQACASLDIPLIHISTDYVFDGEKGSPYLEDDPVNPISVYGLSKWEGEKAIRSRIPRHIIIRTSWLFGIHGHNFVKTMLRLAEEKEELQVVADQQGCPTWTGDLSDALTRLAGKILTDRPVPWGTYHFCGKNHTTWYDFAVSIIDEARKRAPLKAERVQPIKTSSFPTAAKRPMFSVLDCSKIERVMQIHPQPWRKGMVNVLDALLCKEPS